MFGNICSRLKLIPIAHEIVENVPTVSEVVHDVVESVRVGKTDGMPQFMDAGEIHDGVSQ